VRSTLTLVAAVLAAVAVGLSQPPALEMAAPLRFLGHDQVAELPSYGATGTTAVGYRDGRGATIELAVRNAGGVPLTVREVEPFPELLGMISTEPGEGLPVTVAPGETATVASQVRFTNCEYYTERAVNRFDTAQVVVERLGAAWVVEVAHPRQVVLRSPTILGCPERSTDRSARQRLLARDE
jgi:hypothetical protein